MAGRGSQLRTLVSLQHGRQTVTLSTPGDLLDPGSVIEVDQEEEAGLLLGPGQLLELPPVRVWCSSELRIALRSGDGQAVLFELWFREDREEGECDADAAVSRGETPPARRQVGASGGGAASSGSGSGRGSMGGSEAICAGGVRLVSLEFGSEPCARRLRLPRPGWCLLFLDHRRAWFHTATAHMALTLTPARQENSARPRAAGRPGTGRLYFGEAQEAEERRLQLEFDERLQVGACAWLHPEAGVSCVKGGGGWVRLQLEFSQRFAGGAGAWAKNRPQLSRTVGLA